MIVRRVNSQDVPDRRRVSLSVKVRKDGFCPDPRKLKREFSKKYKDYPVKRVGFRAKNPPDHEGSIRLLIEVYLVKEVLSFRPDCEADGEGPIQVGKKADVCEKRRKEVGAPSRIYLQRKITQ